MKQEFGQLDSVPNFQIAKNKPEGLEACVFMTLIFPPRKPHLHPNERPTIARDTDLTSLFFLFFLNFYLNSS